VFAKNYRLRSWSGMSLSISLATVAVGTLNLKGQKIEKGGEGTQGRRRKIMTEETFRTPSFRANNSWGVRAFLFRSWRKRPGTSRIDGEEGVRPKKSEVLFQNRGYPEREKRKTRGSQQAGKEGRRTDLVYGIWLEGGKRARRFA